MKSTLITTLLLLMATAAFTQTQVVKGQIIDKQSEFPLTGATILWIHDGEQIGTVTNIDGYYRLEGIPFGRQAFQINYLGYQTVTIPNVVVGAGKEVVLNISLQESIQELQEVVIVGKVDKDRPKNEFATVSSRQFSMEEVNRYSGGRNDVGRLAANFAGVSTPDDSRNDIVIRGNSPTGVLWQYEGIPIPNPNHFASFGTTGGPVSAVNPNLLTNSDFLTSAFPAQYGNALAGVFDLSMRKGNRDEHEFMLQLGAVSGLEATAEGPIGNKGTTYLVGGRYSFVGLANDIGLPIGTNASPNYQDISFNIDFANGKAGKFSIFGIGGQSDIDFLHDEVDEEDLFAAPDEDAFARSKFGVVGVKHNLLLSDKTYIRTILSGSTSQNQFDQDTYFEQGTVDKYKLRVTEVDNKEYRITGQSYINTKFNARLTGRAGILVQHFMFDLDTRDRDNAPDNDGDGEPDWRTIFDFNEGATLFQAFAQAQYKITSTLTLDAGLHTQFLEFNNDFALEPRAALSWNFRPRHTLKLGYGLHHQNVPLPLLLLESEDEAGNMIRTNEDLKFTRSNHFVLGYDFSPASDWRVKLELYYQAIDRAGVESTPSSFSTLNVGSDFEFPDDKTNLVNEGTGSNYGIELTIEKFFSKGYYGMVTASVYDSKYKGSDGVERNTAFNNQYVLNMLAGKEIPIGKDKRNALTFDVKMTTAGGRYYTPVDLEASQAAGFEILDEQNAFSERFPNYFRLDTKFGIRINSKKKKVSHQFFIDIQNITNNENVFARRYNRQTNEVNEVLQIGFFPDFMYRVVF